MDNFFYDDTKKKVVMGNKKKDVDVKSLIMQNEEERKKRALHKLQMSSAEVIQKELRRHNLQKRLANQIFGDAKKPTLVPIGGDVEMKEESKSSESEFKVDP
jgi:hypothetical protein